MAKTPSHEQFIQDLLYLGDKAELTWEEHDPAARADMDLDSFKVGYVAGFMVALREAEMTKDIK